MQKSDLLWRLAAACPHHVQGCDAKESVLVIDPQGLQDFCCYGNGGVHWVGNDVEYCLHPVKKIKPVSGQLERNLH